MVRRICEDFTLNLLFSLLFSSFLTGSCEFSTRKENVEHANGRLAFIMRDCCEVSTEKTVNALDLKWSWKALDDYM